MSTDGHGRLQFGDFELDSQSGRLLRDGQPIKIQPQPLRLLQLLIEHAGETVPRDELRSHIWNDATFVEFDQGLNYCIRQIRRALNDDALNPTYVETLPKQGYRFIANVTGSPNGAQSHLDASPAVTQAGAELPFSSAVTTTRRRRHWLIAAVICTGLAVVGTALYFSFRPRPVSVRYEQLTDFTDSALAPALSPDGRMVAFIRGSESFLTPDQIYVKMLPNGEPKRLTDDKRLKYNLAFTPDGSQVAYTVFDPTNKTASAWSTYTVSVLGGDPRLLLSNAAGLTWLDDHQLLFSQIRSGMNMGVVTGTVTREHFREIYFPVHERGMAHYSYASPDRKSALVVEMNGQGRWGCRLISLDGKPENRQVGPQATCTSAAWSPDGLWMYFTAIVEGHSHLWRQRFPNGRPEQITFGPTEEEGIAVEQDGRSVITSMGMRESSIWIHDPNGDRSLSSEGEIITGSSPPSFSADGKVLYYLLRHQSAGLASELWRMNIESGESEAVFPGISMLAYDVSPDGKLVVYTAPARDGNIQLWLAPIDKSSPAKHIGRSSEGSPHFGPHGQILFLRAEGNVNYLERMNPDGSGRSKVVSYPIGFVQSVSPFGHWVMGAALPDANRVAEFAIPTAGGSPRVLCSSYCTPTWSPNGKFLFIDVEAASRTSPGRSLAIPVGSGETLPELPPGGIPPLADPSIVPGAQSVGRARLVPGIDPSHFAYVNTTVHRNLYRISIP
jgi:DNA-binding winged helix-turn-helix (wHTH) protein/Tol biopolymer transport system component